MSKDPISSTYTPHVSPDLSGQLSNLQIQSPASPNDFSSLPPPPHAPTSSTVLPDTPPTDNGVPNLPPGTIPPRPISPTVTDPDQQLRRYSRDLAETLLDSLPSETRKSVEGSLIARKKSV